MINAKLLQLVIEASNDGIVVAEQEGDDNILIYANPAFERLTGYAVDDILYRDCRFLQGEDRDQPALQAIREAVKNNQPCRQIIRNYRKDGTPFWNELSITPVFNEADQLTYFIGIQKNVTAEVDALQRVEALEAEIRELKAKLAQN
ncbi:MULTISPECIES: PAS sensor domain-containing protein [Stutzerimonas]|jgi:PAS domain S-box-containing protein|uniref:PAS sensor domain-containing protein n=5 Tax=Stutzerimonas TaxID=2901164 RepID=A0A1I3NMP3_9GAMM|nr:MULTISPECIES: PAS sensor domain-containing protein [Stutzerimonas]MAF86586.1 PAS sensor domain-containing protein [Pseudomonas sp.]MBU0562662.1 PAS sensor domain-containing protein [Gammaproteobacteria bacterium]PKM14044.1 MAG: PAS sensor domain-containing protein [Gammaproteobacteria bacterium HGW-Gammaproteobacteria-5]AFM33430.1 sensory box protein [Stutzerimonas stutzeri CCUG 29243]ESR01486.1 PAS sensor protein [Stutzerimonas chloritidismutans AW-1]|tara:strand:- start:478 stop:918 length:441 start_codon:yes stop_codon:yes gene_type:complete